MAANSRPSVICCVTSAKSQDKHLKPLALTVAQSSRGQQQGMDTCFIRSARQRDKDRRAATEYKGERGKDEKKLHERAKAQFGLHLESRYPQAETVGIILQPPIASLRLFGRLRYYTII